MNIKETFLKLTQRTYPHGTESEIHPILINILTENDIDLNGMDIDSVGNILIKIGESRTMFCSHLDTQSKDISKINHVFDDNFIKTDGTTILGADDKAGVVIMLMMMKMGVPGYYYFFVGEEVGCVGSSSLSRSGDMDFKGFDRCISFDRRGYNSIITEQLFGDSASVEFASELARRLNEFNSDFNFEPDPTGIMTDSASFMDLIPECTNISVGYFNEHQTSEKQDIVFLEKLAVACASIEWEDLPVKRDPQDVYNWSGWNWGKKSKNTTPSDSGPFPLDPIPFRIEHGGSIWLVKLTKERVKNELDILYNWLSDLYYGDGLGRVTWDGKDLKNKTYSRTDWIGSREDLTELIPELTPELGDIIFIKREHIIDI